MTIYRVYAAFGTKQSYNSTILQTLTVLWKAICQHRPPTPELFLHSHSISCKCKAPRRQCPQSNCWQNYKKSNFSCCGRLPDATTLSVLSNGAGASGCSSSGGCSSSSGPSSTGSYGTRGASSTCIAIQNGRPWNNVAREVSVDVDSDARIRSWRNRKSVPATSSSFSAYRGMHPGSWQ